MAAKPAPLTRTEPFWRKLQAQRTAQKGRLYDWWQRCERRSVRIGAPNMKRWVTIKGNKLFELRNPWNVPGLVYRIPTERETHAVVAWYWNGWLVLSKRAPRWVRNWARRELAPKLIEVWAPLTLRVVKECVRFQKDCEKVQRVYDALRPEEEEFPF